MNTDEVFSAHTQLHEQSVVVFEIFFQLCSIVHGSNYFNFVFHINVEKQTFNTFFVQEISHDL